MSGTIFTGTIFVTGASGHLGRAIVDNLIARGVPATNIIAGSRSPEKLAELAAKGVITRKADFDDKAGLEKAFSGVDTVVIVSTDALDGAGTRLRQHKAAVAAAAKAGVKRIAYTSLPKTDTSKVGFAPDHFGSEEAIKATGLPYLIFRDSWYAENLLMVLPRALATGEWYSSAGDGRTAYVWRDDLAAAIAGAVARPVSGSATYTLTGPQAFTNAEIAELAGRIFGKPIRVVSLTDEQLAGGMKAAGVPEAIIPTLVSFETATRAGDLGDVTADVEALSGRKPRLLKDYLEAEKAKFLA